MEGGVSGELHEGKLATGQGGRGGDVDGAGSGHPWVPGTWPWRGLSPTRVSVLSKRLMTWVMKVFILSKSSVTMLPEPSMRKTMSEAFVGQPGEGMEKWGGGVGKDAQHDPVRPIYPSVRSSPTAGTHLPLCLVFSTPHQPPRAPHPGVRPPRPVPGRAARGVFPEDRRKQSPRSSMFTPQALRAVGPHACGPRQGDATFPQPPPGPRGSQCSPIGPRRPQETPNRP